MATGAGLIDPQMSRFQLAKLISSFWRRIEVQIKNEYILLCDSKGPRQTSAYISFVIESNRVSSRLYISLAGSLFSMADRNSFLK